MKHMRNGGQMRIIEAILAASLMAITMGIAVNMMKSPPSLSSKGKNELVKFGHDILLRLSESAVFDRVMLDGDRLRPGWEQQMKVLLNSLLPPGVVYNMTIYNHTFIESVSSGPHIPPWWNTNYGYRSRITIVAGSADVPDGYTIAFTFDHRALVSAKKSIANGDDIRIVYWTGTDWIELDRILDVTYRGNKWNSSSTKILFKTRAPIPAKGCEMNYYLYYGNPNAVNPPRNEANVWAWYCSMDSTSGWVYFGTASNPSLTVSGGRLLAKDGGMGEEDRSGWRNVNSPVLSDFEALLDVEVVGDPNMEYNPSRGGPIFREKSSGGGYLARIKPVTKDRRISAIDDYAAYIEMSPEMYFPNVFDVKYRFKVRMIGWKIEFTFREMDGDYYEPLIYTVDFSKVPPDPRYERGQFGIWTWKVIPGIYFDEFRVRKLVEPEPFVSLADIRPVLMNTVPITNSDSSSFSVALEIASADIAYTTRMGWVIAIHLELANLGGRP